MVMGTPQYMAPEQALGQGDRIDARADQFALASQPGSANDNGSNGSIVRRSRRGGFLNYYQRGAA
jgi:serine/threonine protein kinase